MGYQATFNVLADPTRRALLERLEAGPLPVGRLAAGLPISRPAVSKHLRLMKDAGVVRMTEEGTRNLYEIDLGTLEEVRKYIDRFWSTSLVRLKEAAETSWRGGAPTSSGDARRSAHPGT